MFSSFWTYARPYRGTFALGFGLLLATNALGLWIPWLLRDAINAIESGAPASRIGFLGALMAGVAVLRMGVRTGSRWTILGNSRRIARDIRRQFFGHLVRLDPKFYDENRTGDVMSRGVNDIQQMQGFYGPGMLNFFNTILVYIGVLILLVRLDWMLTLVSMATFPLLFFGVKRISQKVFHSSRAVQEQLSEISSRAQENISGIQQVKTYVQEDREVEGFVALCEEFRRRNLVMAKIRGGMISLIGIFTGVGTLVVLYVGGQFVIQDRISFGDFVAFNSYLGMLVWPTIAFGWIVNTLQRGKSALERLQEIFSVTPGIESPLDQIGPGTIVEGDIEIDHLSFTYPGAESPALRDIQLKIRRGERLAIVGPVGAGKSTLLQLLARLYPIPRNTIRMGGRPIEDIDIASLRATFGVVPQEALLFSRSIKENVLFGEEDADEQELERALQVSHLKGDLNALPNGANTVVGERGFTLSGGQRQRTTLARAVIGQRPILMLDDALASVDADTERAILDHLSELSGQTILLVTHRFTSLGDMDRIVVLDGGRVVEQGQHEELLANHGVYRALFDKQRLKASLGEA